MAKSPDKKPPLPAANDDVSRPRRKGPLTEYLDASEPLERKGFAEAPQADFSGAPLSGSISDWAGQIAREAEAAPTPTSPLRGGREAERSEGEAGGGGKATPFTEVPPPGPLGHPPTGGG